MYCHWIHWMRLQEWDEKRSDDLIFVYFASLSGKLLWLSPSSRTSEASALGSLVRMRWKVPGLIPDATCFDVRVDESPWVFMSSCPEFLTEQLCEDIWATWHVPNHRPCQCGHVFHMGKKASNRGSATALLESPSSWSPFGRRTAV